MAIKSVCFEELARDVASVVARRSSFAEVSWHFKDSALQGGGYAFLYDLTEYFACFM